MARRLPKNSRSKSPRNTIEFDEIRDWQAFEDLVADYFRGIQGQKNITDVTVDQSGEGPDGGRDILVTFQVSDSIMSFERKWIVQCKFYDRSVSKTELSDINIPTLIHEYGAHGYLLVCKGGVTSTVSTMFENLRKKCRMNYSYMFWTGNQFKGLLYLQPYEPLIQKHFPEYYGFLQTVKGGQV